MLHILKELKFPFGLGLYNILIVLHKQSVESAVFGLVVVSVVECRKTSACKRYAMVKIKIVLDFSMSTDHLSINVQKCHFLPHRTKMERDVPYPYPIRSKQLQYRNELSLSRKPYCALVLTFDFPCAIVSIGRV